MVLTIGYGATVNGHANRIIRYRVSRVFVQAYVLCDWSTLPKTPFDKPMTCGFAEI